MNILWFFNWPLIATHFLFCNPVKGKINTIWTVCYLKVVEKLKKIFWAHFPRIILEIGSKFKFVCVEKPEHYQDCLNFLNSYKECLFLIEYFAKFLKAK